MTYPPAENMTGIVDIFEYANTVSDNIFGLGTILSFYIVVASYLHFNRGEEFSDCMVVSGFLTSTLAVLFFLMGLIEDWHLFVTIIVFVISAVWVYSRKSG